MLSVGKGANGSIAQNKRKESTYGSDYGSAHRAVVFVDPGKQ